jgi:hypothetical protein
MLQIAGIGPRVGEVTYAWYLYYKPWFNNLDLTNLRASPVVFFYCKPFRLYVERSKLWFTTLGEESLFKLLLEAKIWLWEGF